MGKGFFMKIGSFLRICAIAALAQGVSQAEEAPDWLVTSPADLEVRIDAIDSFHTENGIVPHYNMPAPSAPAKTGPVMDSPFLNQGASSGLAVSVSSFVEALKGAREAFSARRWKEALAYSTAALKIKPQHREMRYQNAYALAHLGQHEAALSAYNALLEEVPDHRDAWYQSAWSLQKLGRNQDALKAYDKAIESGANSSWIHYDKGILMKKMGMKDEAVAAFERSAELNPKHVWSSLEIANILYDRQDWANASRWYEKVIELKPTAPDAQERLAICQKKLAR